MKISDYPPKGLGNNLEAQNQAQKNSALTPSAVRTARARPVPEGDQVRLSQRSRLIAKTSEAVAAAPDVRAERVADIKARISAGTYSVKGELVAEAILKNHLQEII